MTSDQMFCMKIERIKHLTREALELAHLFGSFRYHQPSMSYLNARAAAQNARQLADELDAMADKIAPAEHLMAAE
jgi:hypothetical protein